MEKLIKYLNRLPKIFYILSGILIILMVGAIDYLTKDFFVLILYTVPVILVAWFAGRAAGALISLVGAGTDLILDIIETPSHSTFLVHYMNTLMNAAIFLSIVYFISAFKNAIETQAKFTATVSHELRTPLVVIKESVNAVLDGLLGDINERQRDILGMALRNIGRLTLMINDILDFQKLDSDKKLPYLEINDLNQVVRETLEEVRLANKTKSLNFILSLDESLQNIRFDRLKIKQVVTNLLGNACKFTDKGNITIGTKKDGNFVLTFIKDEGCGIRREDMPKLFKSFEQFGDSHQQERGTGLGLVISKEIISRHKGKIWAESEYGKGTTFYFTLPSNK